MADVKNLVGQRFNRLTVVQRAPDSPSGAIRWNCVCDCGKTKNSVQSGNLKNGAVKSCGCLRSETMQVIKKTHGLRHTDEYGIWSKMIQRCHNENNQKYRIYGGRGITVCDRWRYSFANFYEDMGPRPSKMHSIDRENNEDGYHPGNCSWATKVEQANNTRTNKLITYLGVTKTLAEICAELGANYHRVYDRLSRGVPFEDAIADRSIPNLKVATYQQTR